jgi:hypothetical protein
VRSGQDTVEEKKQFDLVGSRTFIVLFVFSGINLNMLGSKMDGQRFVIERSLKCHLLSSIKLSVS